MLKETGEGSRRWTKSELLEKGKVKDFEGHHINDVKNNPEMARDPNNIDFVKGSKEHLNRHDGNFKNPTNGELIDRKKLLEERRGTGN